MGPLCADVQEALCRLQFAGMHLLSVSYGKLYDASGRGARRVDRGTLAVRCISTLAVRCISAINSADDLNALFALRSLARAKAVSFTGRQDP